MNSEGNKLYVLCKGAVSQLSSLVHFLITTNHTSLLATKIDKLLENDKSQSRTCQTNMSPKHFFQRRKQQNDEWTLKNCQANMFQKAKLPIPFQSSLSSSISVSCCICCVIHTFVSLHLVAPSSQCLNFDTFRDHYTFLGNCSPTPPLNQHFSQSEKKVLSLA